MTTSRRQFVAAGAAALAARPGFAVSRRRPPNLIFCHVDQLHFEARSSAGCPWVRTPNLDRLAERSLYFSHSYAANPVCCPARAAWYTGRATCETGVVVNERRISEDLPDLGQWFSARGWQAVYAGKWHIPGRQVQRSFRLLTPASGFGEVTDTMISRAAEGFLHGYRGDQPFFLNLGFLNPHDCCYWPFEWSAPLGEFPYPAIADELPPLPANHGFDPREPETFRNGWRSRPNRAIDRDTWTADQWRLYQYAYYRQAEMVDAELGRVLDALDTSGHASDTLLIVTADHGDGLARHQLVQKMYFYEDAARVPLYLSQAGSAPEGEVCDRLTSGLDLPATLCDYAGLEAPPNARGRSLRPLVEGREVAWREFVTAEVSITGRMVRTPEYKLITYRGDATEQLFDLRADPGEMHNLSGETASAGVQADLHRRLTEWEATLAPIPPGADTRQPARPARPTR